MGVEPEKEPWGSGSRGQQGSSKAEAGRQLWGPSMPGLTSTTQSLTSFKIEWDDNESGRGSVYATSKSPGLLCERGFEQKRA